MTNANRVAFKLSHRQVNGLRLLALDPGEVDPKKWGTTLDQLMTHGLAAKGEGERDWLLTDAGKIAAQLVESLTNGHRL